jgi:hypothetical protein
LERPPGGQKNSEKSRKIGRLCYPRSDEGPTKKERQRVERREATGVKKGG